MKDFITRDKQKKGKLSGVAAVAFWVLLWQIASEGVNQELLLASPLSVMRRLGELLVEASFWQSIVFSFGRIVSGFFLALAAGILLAVLAYRFVLAETLLKPLLVTVKSIPVASFIILCLIWIPSENLAVFISFLMVLPVIYGNLFQGLCQTDRKLLEMAQVFCVGTGRKILYIYLSQILPYLLSACSLALGLSWKAGIAAEVIGVPEGSIGEKLYHAKIYLNTPDLFAWTIVVIFISFLFEKCFLRVLSEGVRRTERM